MDQVEQFFDSYAHDFNAIYGTSNSLVNRVLNPILRKSMRIRFEKSILYCQPTEGKTVLDIGCGPGHYAIALANCGAKKIIGIDFAEEMIRIAEKNTVMANVADRCEFIVDDIFKHNFAEKFNFSIIMGVMDYIVDPYKMLETVQLLTKEKAFFSFPKSGGFLALQRQIRYQSRCPLYLYSADQIKNLFNKFSPNKHKIESIKRDYFVTWTLC